jgi:DNA-binding CsgD family transcriptional regulator
MKKGGLEHHFQSRSVYVQILIVVLAFTLLVCISTWFVGGIMNRHMTDSIEAAFSNTDLNISAEMILQEYLKEMRRMRLILIAVGIVLVALSSAILLRPSTVNKKLHSVEGYGLTNREQEIIAMLLDGKAPKEIAHSLKIAIKTVDFHTANLYRKLGIQSRAELFAKYKK